MKRDPVLKELVNDGNCEVLADIAQAAIDFRYVAKKYGFVTANDMVEEIIRLRAELEAVKVERDRYRDALEAVYYTATSVEEADKIAKAVLQREKT